MKIILKKMGKDLKAKDLVRFYCPKCRTEWVSNDYQEASLTKRVWETCPECKERVIIDPEDVRNIDLSLKDSSVVDVHVE